MYTNYFILSLEEEEGSYEADSQKQLNFNMQLSPKSNRTTISIEFGVLVMIIFLSILIWLLAAYKWADWKNWRHYYSTILFFIAGDLVSCFLTYNHPLWELIALPFFNVTFTVLIIAFIAWPASALLYLSLYPKSNNLLKILHILKFAALFTITELIIFQSNEIKYSNGWNILWSLGFNLLIFPLLKIHHEEPPVAWILAFILGSSVLYFFKVPLSSMK